MAAPGRQVDSQIEKDYGEAASAAKLSLKAAYADLIERLPRQISEQLPGKDPRVFFAGLLDFPQLRTCIPRLIHELAQGQTSELVAARAALDYEVAALKQYPQSPLSLPLWNAQPVFALRNWNGPKFLYDLLP